VYACVNVKDAQPRHFSNRYLLHSQKSSECIVRLETILKRKIECVEGDLLDQAAVDAVFKKVCVSVCV
jgi:hypothetical protein